MDKRRPTYDLDAFKAAFAAPSRLAATRTALTDALALGFDRAGMVGVIRGMERRHFYKSMTSYADHSLWQDVYHVPAQGMIIYVKFCADVITEFRLLSFKEK